METPRQPSLFEAGEAGLDPLEGSVGRTWLGDGAWVDLRRGWVRGAGELCDHLVKTVPWQADQRVMYGRMVDVPRLVRFYGEDAEPPDPLLAQARRDLTAYYGEDDPFRTVGCCLYRGGADSVAWHGDRIGRGSTEDTKVAVLSLGGSRRFLLRPRNGGSALRFTLASGDLLVMGGSCQRTWEHSVPKTVRAVEPRISVQFRPLGVG